MLHKIVLLLSMWYCLVFAQLPGITIPQYPVLPRQAAGTMNTIVVFIRFQNDAAFSSPRSAYESDFNSTTATSLKSFYREVSYNKLDINSYLYPASDASTNVCYVFPKARGYFQAYSGSNTIGYKTTQEARLREHEILDSAIIAIRAQVPAGIDLDFNSDGYVDNVMFMFAGSPGPWGDVGLWPHSGVLDTYDARINGKRVYHYSIHLESMAEYGTYCHETFHVIGGPDLYRYFVSGDPAGPWDIMNSNNVHMGAYMKYKYTNKTWIKNIPVITRSGHYTLSPLTSDTNNCYRINSPYTPNEFFVLEYRKRAGLFESNLPGSGLLIYRINTLAGDGNGGGPPDEIYVYRVGGTPTAGGTASSANFSSDAGRTAFNDYTTNPKCFLSNGAKGGIDIRNIGSAGTTISFDVIIVDSKITQPIANTSFASGNPFTVAVTATDSAAIKNVSLYLDNILTATDTTYPYQFQVATTGLAAGLHTIRARALSTTGVFKDDSVQVNITSGAPAAVFTSPADSSYFGLKDTIRIEGYASCLGTGVKTVTAALDGTTIATATSSPFVFYWKPGTITTGAHQLQLTVRDSLNRESSVKRTVLLANYLLREDFEGSWPPAGWQINSSIAGWYQSLKGAYTGNGCAATRNYHPSLQAILTSPAFVPDATTKLSFAWMDRSLDITKRLAGHDTTYCEISVNNGAFSVLRFLAAPDVEPAYHTETISLKDYANQNIRIRWRDVSDESIDAMGTALDNVNVISMNTNAIVPDKQSTKLPEQYLLEQNYPNPFNPSTTISYGLPASGHVRLTVYTVHGKEVAELVNSYQSAGFHSVVFQASRLASGVYFYRLNAGGKTFIRKLVILK
ncbi:MAG: M6 family metalloprotease domain-containing protein [Ignavibacteria bacterium]|nr:M6 family metalloprotease domain-containing protein [Ignavibacteria bacterium]